jgi:hypothetical protein
MSVGFKQVKIGLSVVIFGFAIGWAIANPKKPNLVGSWQGVQRGIATRTEFLRDGTFKTTAQTKPTPIEMVGRWKIERDQVSMFECKTKAGASLPDHTVKIVWAGANEVTFELNGEKGTYRRILVR